MLKILLHSLVACALALTCSATVIVSAEPAEAAGGRVALKKAVTSYSNAFLDGRGARAYSMLTPRCKARISRPDFIDASEVAGIIYGRMPIKSFRATINGKTARATYTYQERSLNQSREPWKKISGRWRMNEC